MADVKIKRGLIETPDGYIHYRTAGEGEPLVLLHQVPLSSLEFAAVLPLLAAKRRVIAFDLLGYGCSDAPSRGLTIGDFATSIIHALNGLKIERADLLGTHTGGVVANEIAATSPDRVHRLIVSGPAAWESWQQRYEFFARCRPFELDAEGASIKAQWETLSALTDDVTMIRRFITEKIKASPIWYAGYVAVFSADFAASFAQVIAPTMFLTGSRDMLAACGARLKALRPEVYEVIIADAGNWLAWEVPERFVAEVEQFLTA